MNEEFEKEKKFIKTLFFLFLTMKLFKTNSSPTFLSKVSLYDARKKCLPLLKIVTKFKSQSIFGFWFFSSPQKQISFNYFFSLALSSAFSRLLPFFSWLFFSTPSVLLLALSLSVLLSLFWLAL